MTNPQTLDEILRIFANTIALSIMGDVPGAKGTPIFTKPEEAKLALRQLINEKLPKGDDLIDDPNLYSAAFGQGYVKALADVKRALAEIFGEGK